MRRFATLTALLSLAVLLAGGASLAEDKKADPPDEKAMFEAMMKAATPGEQHKRLAEHAGSWDATVKMWMDPSKPPSESKATAESKMIMDGRYLEEKVTGEFGGMKFHGQGLTGYDNVQKKFKFAWVDNMGTGISTALGTYDPDKKTVTFLGEEIDPVDGKPYKTKSVTHFIDKDKFEVDMYRVVDGKDLQAMHIAYVRKAAK